MMLWLLDRLFRREERTQCEDDHLYLVRWPLWGSVYNTGHAVCLHWLVKSSEPDRFHDHPWNYWSLILCGGYFEQTPNGTRWYGPGRILFRPRGVVHRLIVPEGRTCWTLVFVGKWFKGWEPNSPKVECLQET